MNDITQLKNRYRNGRANLLILALLTAVNIVLILIESDVTFLFSATSPTLVFYIASYLYGSAAGAIAAFSIVAIFLLCYFMSNKHHGWIVAALILFIADCLVLAYFIYAYGFDTSYLIDIAFHVYVLATLIMGAVADVKLSKAAKDGSINNEPPAENAQLSTETINVNPDLYESSPLHPSDDKGVLWIDATSGDLHIIVRNKPTSVYLAVNGQVYDETSGIMPKSFFKEMKILGTNVAWKMDYAVIKIKISVYVNGELVARETRIS